MKLKIREKIFKQYNIGIWWGALRNTVSNASMYLSLFNTAMLIPMAYVSWFQPWSADLGWNISFWAFILGIIILGIIVLLVEYKLFTPSNFEFWADQFWRHGDNPVSKRIDDLEVEIKELKSMLAKDEKSD